MHYKKDMKNQKICSYPNKKYEKPRIVKITKMRFPFDILEKKTNTPVCKQCSACHSCR